VHDRVVELRQYTLHPGQRDVLIELFDREFVETQEAVGARVIGQFTDLDRPDRFVWLRGFAGMDARREALGAFYGGPVWARHKDVANATMVEFDDVLLLRPATLRPAFGPADRPAAGGAGSPPDSRFTVTVFPVAADGIDSFVDLVEAELEPSLALAGSSRIALLRTEPAANTFPALPVREGETVVVRIARHDSAEALTAVRGRLAADAGWAAAQAGLRARLVAPVTELVLRPTGRSALR
jgi:hypothetical protein